MAFLSDIRLTKQGKIFFSLLGIVLLGVPLVVYGMSTTQKRDDEMSFLEKVTSPEAEENALSLLEKVKLLIEVPAEVPSVATVSDIAKLRAEDNFYARAENGDKLLIFQKAHKAIIYRERENKIIEVATVVFPEEEQARQKAVAGASSSAAIASSSADTSQTPPDIIPLE